MPIIELRHRQIVLRDFSEADRAAFVEYQTDPRYFGLYDFEADACRSSRLFDQFVNWGRERPRINYQLGIFDSRTGQLLGSGGLRKADDVKAVLGMELAPENWGRYRLAIDTAIALFDFGFGELQLETIFGDTASGNSRVAKLAKWFGAETVARREGPAWMQSRGWQEVDWSVRRETWLKTKVIRSRALGNSAT